MSRLLLQKAASRSLFSSAAGRCGVPKSYNLTALPASISSSSSSSLFHSSTTTAQQRSQASRRRKFQTKFDLPDPAVANEANSVVPLTKIVATIGPTSEQAEPLKQCVRAGLHIMRLNFSHATPEEVELRCANLKSALVASAVTGRTQDRVGILLDTRGPELRAGKLACDVSGHDTVELVAGETVTLHAQPATLPDPAGSTATDLLIDFPVLADVLEPGRQVLLDDGAVVLAVVATDPAKQIVTARVQNSGSLRSRAGVNLPLAETAQHLPALSAKDKADIAYGMEAADVDFVAASFVQTAQHVVDIRRHCAAVAAQLPAWRGQPLPLVVSKIETASALRHFDEILEASDAIMVARGDLGVEIPLQQVTNAQKEMVAACNAAGKPVIVATQMLESMSKAPRPTRAEVSDVTNAVYDGADCVMCSGETAKGRFPVQTIKTMREIIISAERYASNLQAIGHPEPHKFLDSPQTAVSAIAKAAVTAAGERADCAAILVVLQPPAAPSSGTTATAAAADYTLAGLVAAHRPGVPVFAFCHTPKQARQLQIYRGIQPVLLGDSVAATGDDCVAQALQEVRQGGCGGIRAGDEVVLVVEDAAGSRSTASVRIHAME